MPQAQLSPTETPAAAATAAAGAAVCVNGMLHEASESQQLCCKGA
jgi:hypothetical protein